METLNEIPEDILNEILNEIPEEKACTKCGVTWPLESGFYDDKKAKDGKFGVCKVCRDAYTRVYEKRRLSEPLSPPAEAMKKLYAARFRALENAGLPIDVEGLTVCNKIDRVLKKQGLYYAPRITPAKDNPVRHIPVAFNTKRFKGGNKPRKK